MISQTVSLRQCVADLHDPRRAHGRDHDLWDILGLTICAVVAGADSWVEVEENGHCKLDWLKTFLTLPHGIPAHDTLDRVFALINPAAFQQCFQQWGNALVEATAGRVIAIDGSAESGGSVERILGPAVGVETERPRHEIVTPEMMLKARLVNHADSRCLQLVPQLNPDGGPQFTSLQFFVRCACTMPRLLNGFDESSKR